VSIVVTAHDAADTIGDCLRSLARQRGPAAGAIEIVLVDDRCRDGTADVARAGGTPGLRIVRIDTYDDPRLTARQVALHRGISEARGDVVLLTDADAVAAPGWVASVLDRLQAEGADAVAGPVIFRPPGAGVADLQTTDSIFYLDWVRRLARLGWAPGVLFGNFGFRRRVYEAVGGFPAIGPALTEDLAFARALHARGARIAFAPRPLVSVRAAPGWAALVARAQRTSAGGVSALSVSLAVWMLALPALAAAAPFSGLARAALGIRYAAGAVRLGVALARAGLVRLLPCALVYEPLSIALGAGVLARVLSGATVEWGGVRYARGARREREAAR
jgi:cellulose synthase/poly-beta-1,6-N-acetylglucosamine synthase-like glycosyltransferase